MIWCPALVAQHNRAFASAKLSASATQPPAQVVAGSYQPLISGFTEVIHVVFMPGLTFGASFPGLPCS